MADRNLELPIVDGSREAWLRRGEQHREQLVTIATAAICTCVTGLLVSLLWWSVYERPQVQCRQPEVNHAAK